MACYVKDVWERLPLLKASMTSIYGEILKIDSTKKVRLKLRESALPAGDKISSSNKTVIVFFFLEKSSILTAKKEFYWLLLSFQTLSSRLGLYLPKGKYGKQPFER